MNPASIFRLLETDSDFQFSPNPRIFLDHFVVYSPLNHSALSLLCTTSTSYGYNILAGMKFVGVSHKRETAVNLDLSEPMIIPCDLF